jgi:predicted nucleic acid-binding protein
MNAASVIVDANIAFKSLCTGRGDLRRRLAPDSNLKFYCPRYLFVELFKHKERLARATSLTEADLLEGLYALVSQLEFVNEVNVPMGTWVEAYRLSKGIDEKDTPYLALTLHMDGRLWTEDRELKTTLQAKGFNRFFEP